MECWWNYRINPGNITEFLMDEDTEESDDVLSEEDVESDVDSDVESE